MVARIHLVSCRKPHSPYSLCPTVCDSVRVCVSAMYCVSLCLYVYCDHINRSIQPNKHLRATQTKNTGKPSVVQRSPQQTSSPTRKNQPTHTHTDIHTGTESFFLVVTIMPHTGHQKKFTPTPLYPKKSTVTTELSFFLKKPKKTNKLCIGKKIIRQRQRHLNVASWYRRYSQTETHHQQKQKQKPTKIQRKQCCRYAPHTSFITSHAPPILQISPPPQNPHQLQHNQKKMWQLFPLKTV